MKYWLTGRNAWLDANPYKAPYKGREAAEHWAATIRAVHTDAFRVVPVEGGFCVEQDERDAR